MNRIQGVNLLEFRVCELLKMRVLENAKVIAGSGGTQNAINGVTIMESPDIADWLKGGELILTSMHSINHFSEKEKKNVIVQLAQKEVSALGIKIRKTEDKIPQVIIDAGNELNIAIIELPREVPFVDIMYPVMEELFSKQVKKLKYYKEVHDRFTTLALADGGLEAIVTSLELLIGNPVAIYDRDFNCLASTDSSFAQFEVLSKYDDLNNNTGINFSHYKQRVIFSQLNQEEKVQIIIPIHTVNNIKTYLAVTEINKSLGELDYIAMENAATILCLELVKQFSVAQVERKFNNDLIDDLVLGKAGPLDKIYERANLIGLQVKSYYSVVLVNIDSLYKHSGKPDANNHGRLREFEERIHAVILESINAHLPRPVVRTGSNRVIILWEVKGEKHNDREWTGKIKRTCEEIQKRIKKQIKDISLSIGIGGIAKNLEGIAQSYREAQEALDLGKITDGEEVIIAFLELGILRLLCKFNDLSQLSNFIPPSLKKLIEYDQSNKNELLNTLETFLNCNGSTTKTAQALFVHYKTVVYRLERIKDITNLEFDNHEDMLEIQVGLKILKLINKKR
jgi:PucR family transcriptional regulator, purine catabolism regulatory protein